MTVETYSTLSVCHSATDNTLLLLCFSCTGTRWLKWLIFSLSLRLCLWPKIHTLADKLHLVRCALKVTWKYFLGQLPFLVHYFGILVPSVQTTSPAYCSWVFIKRLSRVSHHAVMFEGWLASHTVLVRGERESCSNRISPAGACSTHQRLTSVDQCEDNRRRVYFQLIIGNILISFRISSENWKT